MTFSFKLKSRLGRGYVKKKLTHFDIFQLEKVS